MLCKHVHPQDTPHTHHTHTHTHTHARTHTHTHARTHTHTHARTHTRTHAHTHTRTHITHTDTHTSHTQTHTHHTHTHHTHTHRHTHTHTHTHTGSCLILSLDRSMPGLERRMSASSSFPNMLTGVTVALPGDLLRGVTEPEGGRGRRGQTRDDRKGRDRGRW